MGTAINMTQVKTADWPKANMPQGAFAVTDQVIGRTSIQTLMPVSPSQNQAHAEGRPYRHHDI